MESGIEAWLRAFAGAVRARDYAAGRSLFASEVIAFGTVVERAVGIDTLAARQWKVVWETTRDFDFDYASVCSEVVGDRAWVTPLWTSTATAGANAGARRSGRASLVLAREGAGWRALHSHFSLTPRDPA